MRWRKQPRVASVLSAGAAARAKTSPVAAGRILHEVARPAPRGIRAQCEFSRADEGSPVAAL